MTTKELSQLYYLNREIEQDRQRLIELEAAATSITPKITGLPHVAGISDKTALAAEITDMKNIIEAKNVQCIAERNRILRFIESVDDSYIRQIMTFRCAECMSWEDIADELYTSSGSIKMAYHRYLKKRKLLHMLRENKL